MYESGHAAVGDEVQAALLRLESVLSARESELTGAEAAPEASALAALRHHLALMRDEAERLRHLLGG